MKHSNNGPGVQIIRLKTFPYSFSGRVFVSGLQRTLNRIKPDVVYSHSLSAPMTLITSRWLKRERRKRPVFTILDDHMVFVATENKFSSLFYKLLGLFFISDISAFSINGSPYQKRPKIL